MPRNSKGDRPTKAEMARPVSKRRKAATNKGKQEVSLRKAQTEAKIRRVKELWAKGRTEAEMVKDVGVCPKQIYNYKCIIKEELVSRIKNEESPDILVEMLVNMDEVLKRFWELYDTTDDDKVRLGILRSVTEFFDKKIKLLQSMGLVKKEADNVKVEGSGFISAPELMTILSEIGKKLPDSEARSSFFDKVKERLSMNNP